MSGKKGWFIQGLKDTESTTFETPPNNPEITTFGTTPHHTGGTTFHFGAEQKKIILCVFFGICAILISIFVCRGKILISKIQVSKMVKIEKS